MWGRTVRLENAAVSNALVSSSTSWDKLRTIHTTVHKLISFVLPIQTTDYTIFFQQVEGTTQEVPEGEEPEYELWTATATVSAETDNRFSLCRAACNDTCGDAALYRCSGEPSKIGEKIG